MDDLKDIMKGMIDCIALIQETIEVNNIDPHIYANTVSFLAVSFVLKEEKNLDKAKAHMIKYMEQTDEYFKKFDLYDK